MNDKELKEVLDKLGLKKENFPKILSTDPQAVAISATPGQVLKVKRNDNGHEHDYYRLVVEG